MLNDTKLREGVNSSLYLVPAVLVRINVFSAVLAKRPPAEDFRPVQIDLPVRSREPVVVDSARAPSKQIFIEGGRVQFGLRSILEFAQEYRQLLTSQWSSH